MKRLPVSIIVYLLFLANSSSPVTAQITSSTSSNQSRTPEVTNVQDAINVVLDDSGRLFKEGLLAVKDNRRSDAGEKFNKSIEVFLYSTLNIQKDQMLRDCYNQLIETVYRIEFPFRTQNPQMSKLALTCGWKWAEKDLHLADSIAKSLENLAAKQIPISEEKAREFIERQTSVKEVADKARSAVEVAKSDLVSILVRQNKGELLDVEYKNAQTTLNKALDEYVKVTEKLNKLSNEIKADSAATFSTQKFEPSPLDELAKLELDSSASAATKLGSSIRVVKAQPGDTVSKLAVRYGANATDVAKLNGMLVNSVLGEGREIRIPGLDNGPIKREDIYGSATNGLQDCNKLPVPVIQRLKLGSTLEEVSRTLKRKIITRRFPDDPETSFASVQNIKGLKEFYLNFYKNKLMRIKVAYDNSIEWKGISEFQAAVSKSLGFPNSWRASGYLQTERSFFCTNFEMTISEVARRSYMLTIIDIILFQQSIKEQHLKEVKRRELQNQKKEAFKP